MDAELLGRQFEREIREQPAVWEGIATSAKAERLARAIGDEVVLVGSGSSLFAAELGALALRRRQLSATALPATEARLDHRAFEGKIVIAISQSGRSTDVLDALDVLRPRLLIALTNSPVSPLADRAQLSIDVGAGAERAVPASKSVSATTAIMLWAASLIGGEATRGAPKLKATADTVRAWLESSALSATIDAARELARRRSVVLLGSDYGLPIARETALKLKEASYLHAEGYAAGEFRHGSAAMVDESYSVIGVVDEDALPVVARAMREIATTGAARFVIGPCEIDDAPCLGPIVDDPYNTLAWIVTAQMLALHAARARGIDPDTPRGLTKALIDGPQ